MSFLQSLIMLLFPPKNGNRNKIKKYIVTDHNCRIILSNIELLTVVPIDEITTVLRYISTLTVLQPELTSFCSYLDLTWRRRFEPQLWNISNINDNNIAGRTSNALERYHRRIGKHFANAHPNLASFILIIRTEFLYYSERCAEILNTSSGIAIFSLNFSFLFLHTRADKIGSFWTLERFFILLNN
ncbi:hypothetical protein HZS_4316 [Henneguya salminicola]|nr:hypothetical protein HZS_4316 [Henneguya salminicola]